MHLSDLGLCLHGIPLFDHDFEQAAECVLDVRLYEPELLITLVLEYLAEQRHIVIIPQISLDPIDDGRCPLYYDVFETILLVEVSVHVLLHCLTRLLQCLTFLVEFDLLRIDIIDDILELLQGQIPSRRDT